MYFNDKAYDELYPTRRRDELVKTSKQKESVIETFTANDDTNETPDAVEKGEENADG